MIDDRNISRDVMDAIASLTLLKFVFERDGFVSPKYLDEKLSNAEYALKNLRALLEGEE